ncbi:GNAT family acetyltransferase [Niabella ginsenosidivorans]|uniref:GNAT family acetyltransferase n=1 Tax=Niabella ginsenosidivorans TaxID=1176587 RepID=A0A1A9I9M3_9BACT|nr:GNAT family acetyltransferase [Niabella ginsenosidivorans]
MISLETERVFLKPTDENDAAFIFYLMNAPKWLKYIGNRDITSFEKARKYILQRIKPQQERLGFGNFTIIRKADHKKIGTVGLYHREGHPAPDIGFALLPRFEKMGYAFEAAHRLIEAGFDLFGLEKIWGITSPGNLASQKLLYRLGLKMTGTIRLPDATEELYLFETLKPEHMLTREQQLFPRGIAF